MGDRHVRSLVSIAVALILAACGTTQSAPPTATSPPTRMPPTASAAPPTLPATTPAVTAAAATPPPAPIVANRQTLPDRAPDMTTGGRSDGWVLDRIEASESGGRVTLTLRFEPLPGQAGGPQADVWFDANDTTYSIAVRGVRGSNLVLRPGEVAPLDTPPLRGYYALPLRDDTIFAVVIVASRAPASWTITTGDGPGLLRLVVETR